MIPNQIPSLNFDLGEHVDILRDMVASFTADEVAPRAAEIDRSNEFPMDLWQKFGKLGLLGITADPDYGVVVHRFMGQAETSIFSYPPNVVHDNVVAGVEYQDFPAIDEDGDGDVDRRFIYGPRVVEVGLNIPGRLTGSPATSIEHLIDDFNPPKPSPYASPNGDIYIYTVLHCCYVAANNTLTRTVICWTWTSPTLGERLAQMMKSTASSSKYLR